jgi:hypothetical protein
MYRVAIVNEGVDKAPITLANSHWLAEKSETN